MTEVACPRVRRVDGSRALFCDQLCMDRWFSATGTRWDTVQYREDLLRADLMCLYCAWCGVAVTTSPRCRLHHEGCPDIDLLQSERGRKAVQLLRDMLGGDVPLLAFDYLREAGELLEPDGDGVSEDRLMARMVASRMDWE
jgi:hypothetical protein